MAQATNQYKRTVGGTIGAGIGSVFGGSGKTYFILEHKTDSKYHRAGETQEIIVDQIEIGRDAKCQVRYDDSFTTVSNQHAAIYREGNRWKLIHQSKTNSTLLNGQRVDSEVYLQNGDEIQLSSTGPKLGFIVPTGKKSTVGSIGLTRRLSLFRQQALTPYKRAITALSVILLLVIAGGVWWGLNTGKNIDAIRTQLLDQQAAIEKQMSDNNSKVGVANFDSVKIANEKLGKELETVQARLNALPQGRGTGQPKVSNPPAVAPITTTPSTPDDKKSPAGASDLSSCNQYVYAIFVTDLIYSLPNNGEETDLLEGTNKFIFVGTGFMLNDGRFVTARHVVEPWYYYSDFSLPGDVKAYQDFNYAAFNMGKIYAKYTIVSPTNKRYSFTNEQIICNRANDRISKEDYNGEPAIFRTSVSDRYDWAYYQTGETNALKYDNALSAGLTQGTQLDILGYPGGSGISDINNIQPGYSSCMASGNGLNSNGLILASNIPADGNTGCPVFAKKDGEYVVVGLLTGGMQNAGQKGVIVPISEVRR